MPDQCNQLFLTLPTPSSTQSGVTFTCEWCGSSFYRYPADIRKAEERGARNRYCSRSCAHESQSCTNRECICELCGKTFTVWASRFKFATPRGIGAGRFCSASCRDRANGIRQTDFEMVACHTCGKLHRRIPALMREHMYCSVECMGAGFHKRATLHGVCKRCGCEFEYAKGRPKQYCSARCLHKAMAERFAANRTHVPCTTCGKMTSQKPYRMHGQKRFYCSRSCMHKDSTNWRVSTVYKHGFRHDLGHRVRSSWEANVARFFRFMGWSYEFEPRRFDIGGASYTPDFHVNGYWVEVKGQWRPGAAEKIESFHRLYPDETLIVVDGDLYRKIADEFKDRIPEWEHDYRPRHKRASVLAVNLVE